MSNYKKKKAAEEQYVAYAKEHSAETKRDQEIIGSLYAGVRASGQPINKKDMRLVHAGAVWADEHPAKKTKWKWFVIGGLSVGLVNLIVWLFYLLVL